MKGSARIDKRRPVVDGKPYWRLRVYAGIDPVTGKERFRERGLRGTERAAHQALRKFAAEVDEGQHAGTDGTVAQLLEGWMAHFAGDWSPTTLARYEEVARLHIVPAIGDVALSKLKPTELDALYRRLLRDGLSPATVRKVHNVVRRSLNQAVMWGWINANPALRASAPKPRQGEITPPSAEQVARLMEVAWKRNPDFATYLALAAATGARRGELCGLRHSDFDAKESTLLIARAVVQVGQVLTVKGTKTDRHRRITLDEDTAVVLAAHIERSRARFIRPVPNPYIFNRSADGGEHLKPGNVSTNWRHLCEAAGVKGVRLHDLRHYHGTGLLTAGVDVRTVAGRLGHANPSMTLKVYGHFMPAADAAAAKLWAERTRAAAAPAVTARTGTEASPA